MARNKYIDNSLETLVRQIAREEIRAVFLNMHDLGSSNKNQGNEAQIGSVIKRRRSRKSNITTLKGRVTSPNDKRLKINREANA